MPVREFERGVDGLGGTQCLLCRDDAFQYVAFVLGVVVGKVEHKACGLLHQTSILIHNALAVGGFFCASQQFGKVDQMGLLPDEEATHL